MDDSLSLSNDVSDTLNTSSFGSTSFDDTKPSEEEQEEVSLEVYDDEPKEIGRIAEREITLKKFELSLKIKRTILFICYLILFSVESAYFSLFSYCCICPLLLSLSWFLLLSFNTNLYQYLYQRTCIRMLFILLMSILNIFSVLSLIVIYSINFSKMHNFNHNQDYCFEVIISFNILALFCFFCIDINLIGYTQYSVHAFKIIFFGTICHETFQIDEINGKWYTKRQIFEHPSPFEAAETLRKARRNRTEPIGIWQRLVIFLFVIGILGSVTFTIRGIEAMQPYIN